jgi:cytochrome P450
MSTPVSELDIPQLPLLGESERDVRIQAAKDAAKESWIAKNLFGYSILRYEDTVAVLRDKRWHSAVGLLRQLQPVTNERFNNRPDRRSILSVDGDEHTRLRRLVAPAFSPRATERLRPVMREVVNGLVDQVAPAGRAEIVADICEPYPIPIICELLGAPKEDWKFFSKMATDILRIFNGNLERDADLIVDAQEAMDAYATDLIEQRRSVPRDDLLTDLIAAEEQGDKLSTTELVTMVEAVIIGGTDTTRNQLGLAMVVFAEHPEQWALLAEQPELAQKAVEETMRWFGAVRGTGRIATEDIEYNGVLFPKGTFISPGLGVSNFDASVFPDPERFDITREPVGQPQLTFGSGIHYCLGAHLARAELQEAFRILSARMPDLRLVEPPEFKDAVSGIFGPERVMVEFTPGH